MSALRDNLTPAYWEIIDTNYTRAEQLAASLWAQRNIMGMLWEKGLISTDEFVAWDDAARRARGDDAEEATDLAHRLNREDES